jgi:hypothetical protein
VLVDGLGAALGDLDVRVRGLVLAVQVAVAELVERRDGQLDPWAVGAVAGRGTGLVVVSAAGADQQDEAAGEHGGSTAGAEAGLGPHVSCSL